MTPPRRPGGRRPPGRGGKGAPRDGRRRPTARSPGADKAGGGGRPGRRKGGRPRPDRQDRRDGPGGAQVEGRQAVRELLIAGRRKVRSIVVDRDRTPGDIVDLAREQRIPVTEASPGAFRAEARTEAPQGVVAHAAPVSAIDLDVMLARPDALLLALDGVTDPGNLGAVLRSADGAGVTGVILPRHRAAHLSPAATKAAAGAVEHLEFAVVGGIPAAIRTLDERGVATIGLDPAATTTVWDVHIPQGCLALVLGAEGDGLSRLVRARCGVLASIPLRGALPSLNVAAAGAVALFTVAHRQGRAPRVL